MKTVSKNWIYKNLKSFNQNNAKVKSIVESIIKDVQRNGDKALLKYIKKFENSKAELKDVVFSKKQLAYAYQALSLKEKKALKLAHQRIYYYHSKQIRKSYSFRDQEDSKFHIQWNPIENVGLYVPGGMASYPSTVLMTSIPAKIAKVPNVMMCVPEARHFDNHARPADQPL